jgi:DNA replication ATP-dependent helicase Dna2
MATQQADPRGKDGARREARQSCFLCALDPHPCSTMQIEGRIIAAREHSLNGERVPIISLDTGTTLVSVILTRYYRSMVKGLNALGSVKYSLTLRVYHLPGTPIISEHKGRPLHGYQANSYTLAVLEPDTLLNITDLNQAEYCPRQYLLRRLAASPTSAAAIRGNLVHNCFKELLKEHDRGELMIGHTSNEEELPLATLQRHLEEALERSSLDLALANVASEAIRADVAPHLESLARWYENQRSSLWDMPTSHADEQSEEGRRARRENFVRAETFLLAPEIGLKGRLDLLWQQSGRQRLLELKTGGTGDLPKREHRWQVHGYHALLTVRRDSRMKKALATLLYSGTPTEAQAFGIPFSVRELQLVNETRNILALSHVTGTAPAPPGPSRCTKCAMLDQCTHVSSLLNWQPPQPGESASIGIKQDIVNMNHVSNQVMEQPPGHDESRPYEELSSRMQTQELANVDILPHHIYNKEDWAFFARYYKLLHLEGHAGEQQQALLWKTTVAERVERGTALNDLQPVGKPEPTGQGEWLQTFRCVNNSELREGDEILLSDGNPVTGEVVTGTIISISAEQVTTWNPELITHPSLIDRYDTDIVHVRTLQNLLRWLQATPRMRGLVTGQIQPGFNIISVLPRADFNAEQNLAIERAMQMQDYLLIHGPPGTGKTSVIAEIVKRFAQQGQRVMLAAFTNQAVDNMLKRLGKEGFHDYVRLGHDRSVDASVQDRLLKSLVSQKPDISPTFTSSVHDILHRMPVVASTTATWSSEKYTPTVSANGDSALQFDVALIDEAGQLTVPAILGALRFAKRFILVGDEKQLPPLVLSKEAADAGLSTSLFSELKQRDEDNRKVHSSAVSACVPLRVQYRMHRQISDFASKTFYNGLLIADRSVASRVLKLIGATTAAPAIKRAIHPGFPMVFLDVRSKQENTGPKISNAEARVVREIVAELLVQGIKEADIGIIAPYRAQVANLRRHLLSDDQASGWQALKPDSPLSIDTVDRFQGGERLVIIMSFATTSPPAIDTLQHDFLTNPNRLNVALTRAQRKLILVGCAPALAHLPVFQRLLSHCQRLNTLIPYRSLD